MLSVCVGGGGAEGVMYPDLGMDAVHSLAWCL